MQRGTGCSIWQQVFLKGNLDEYADKIIRVGHMANISLDEMKTFLKILKETLQELRSSE